MSPLEPNGGVGGETSSADGLGSSGSSTQDATAGASVSSSGSATEISSLALGAACEANSDCQSSYCVDGVCCDSPCEELCATCSAPGSEGLCSAAPFDPACDSPQCRTATECTGFVQENEGRNCTAVGECRVAAECTEAPREPGEPCAGGEGTCDGSGACIVEGKAALGQACEQAEDCAEGHCVENAEGLFVCCDAACDNPCEACSAAGRCDVVPVQEARCPEVTCPADNVCLDYPDLLPAGQCRVLGECSTAKDCVAAQLRPASTCSCDVDGSCALRTGQRCEQSSDCESGNCIPNVAGQGICCANSCGGSLFCAADGESCVECQDTGAIDCESGAAVRCLNGSRVFETCSLGCQEGVGCNSAAPVGASCASAACSAEGVCQSDTSGAQRCCVRDCAGEGRVCAPDGSCQCPEGQQGDGDGSCALQQGDPCQVGGVACAAGLQCVDGVCCNAVCSGACESCNQPGSAGQCTFLSTDPASCGAGRLCVARGDCRAVAGQRCTEAVDCASGACEEGTTGQRLCCAFSCSGDTPFCSSDGQRCVECDSAQDCNNGCDVTSGRCRPLQAAGALCSVDRQCQSGDCVSASDTSGASRCCQGCAPGQLCSSNGTCVDPPALQGAPCGTGVSCGPGLTCVDGVCCQAACSGVCQQCSSTGVCNITPATDPACNGTCPQSTVCRSFTAPPLSSCGSFGTCQQCTALDANAQISCDPGRSCDGQGNCVVDRSKLATKGELSTCATTSAGRLRCWGLGSPSNGYGHNENIGDDETPAQAAQSGLGGDVDFGSARQVVQVDKTSLDLTCILFADGGVRCFGGNLDAAGTTAVPESALSSPAAWGDVELGGARAVSIATGLMHACALLESGAIRCWGRNFAGGELGVDAPSGGNAPPIILPTPTLNTGGLRALSIAAGRFRTCAVLQGGLLRCWGQDMPGLNTNIDAGGVVQQVSVGLDNICALLTTGEVHCWGDDNAQGQLGLGHTNPVPMTAPASQSLVQLGAPALQVEARGTEGACALLVGGAVRCWGIGISTGYGHDQHIGDDETPAQSSLPGGLGGNLDFGPGSVMVALSTNAGCAWRSDGRLFCWGFNEAGEVGVPDFPDGEAGLRTPRELGPVDFE